ncbi:MAG: hypothetical protein RR139_09830 [Lachnospiraceae bacterium]
MKLLFMTMEGCGACIEKRDMVYNQLPTVFPGLTIQELDLDQWDELTEQVGQELPYSNCAPGFVMLDDDGHAMFQVVGTPGPQYLARLVRQYRLVSGFSITEASEDEPAILSLKCVKGICRL